jgi:HlyD family type I secretion membrane fusion protein
MNRDWSARGPLVVGYAAIAILVGGLSAWGLGTQLAGAVIAPGTVRVESERQVVQHPDGGVVGEILARNGDRVEQGELLIRIDGTFMRSELAAVESQIIEIHARKARLAAERDGEDTMTVPPPPEFDLLDPDEIEEQIAGQRNLFEARLASLRQEQKALKEQSAQIDRQVEGYEAQLEALDRQLDIASGELENVRGLFGKGLIQSTRVSELEREDARLRGELGRLTALVAEATSRQSSLEIEALKLIETRREEAISTLRDLGYNEIELKERRLGLTERLARLDLRAPVDGTVFGSEVFAIGAVIRAADPVMYIVPGSQPLQIAARVSPTDVEQVYPGQPVTLVLSAFNTRTTPEVPGEVLRVSADAVTDESTGQTYYEAMITPDATTLEGLENIKLLPGMPVETFLKTESRSPFDYLTQPLTVYFSRAFREE